MPPKCQIIIDTLLKGSFSILLFQYLTFLYCCPLSYCSSNFAIAKVVAHNLFAAFLTSATVISLLKVITKGNRRLFAIAFKSKKERQLWLYIWKSDNFKESNQEKKTRKKQRRKKSTPVQKH